MDHDEGIKGKVPNTNRTYERECSICEEIFDTACAAAKFCPSCRERVIRIRTKLGKKGYDKKYLDLTVPRLVKKELEREYEDAATLARLRPYMAKHPGRCLFCGLHLIEEKPFCDACVEQRFSNVFLITRRSNGWDRK